MSTLRTPSRALLFVAALLTPLAVLAEPAAAATTVAGTATFHGTAWLPSFPCPTSPMTPCTGGAFSGQWEGHLSGHTDLKPFEVSWQTALQAAPAVTASFSYNEVVCLGGLETLSGTAFGTGSATADPAHTIGYWYGGVVGEVPQAVIGVRLLFDFEWFRAGNSAVIVVKPGSRLEIDIAGIGWRTVSTSEQDGVASFVPLGSSNTPVPGCSTPLTGVTGQIAGDLALR
jgi:hypothetical protein